MPRTQAAPAGAPAPHADRIRNRRPPPWRGHRRSPRGTVPLASSVAAGAQDGVADGDLVAVRAGGLAGAGLGCLDAPALAERGGYLFDSPAVLQEVGPGQLCHVAEVV